MAESLERAEHLRRQMVSDIAHELRTPLTTIQAYLDACEDGVLEPGPAIILSLQEEAMLLARLVADLQELSIAEAGHLKLDCTPLALERCLHAAMQSVQAGAREKHVTLAVEVLADLPFVTADAGRVGQILRNLLTNALTHTPAGGTITVSAVCRDREVEVSIKDTGSGIAPEHVPYLFERFYRADVSRSRKTGGTGLGLAIVKQLVKPMAVTFELKAHRVREPAFSLPCPSNEHMRPDTGAHDRSTWVLSFIEIVGLPAK
ncbi:MAG: ATP-binding protein [Chloroflexota bacterium]|nr:ATP-binding protein [Chloroflexota bacterium]